MDANFVIKVADFGLSADVYLRNYFRPADKEGVKLPAKCMAIESLHDGLFTEKTDVVSKLYIWYAAVWSACVCVFVRRHLSRA